MKKTVEKRHPFLSNRAWLVVLCVVTLVWMGIVAWPLVRPLTWASVPVGLCFGYTVYRILFELTFNRKNIPTLAMSYRARREVARVIKRESQSFGAGAYYVVDLGSGRGELARHIARSVPQARVLGIELAPIPSAIAMFFQRWLGPKNLSFKRCDFWPFDCSSVHAAVLYLVPAAAVRMGEKLNRELKTGSLVISHSFPLLGAWTPLEVHTFYTPFKETLYIYRQK